jgi:ABC-type uncharacterized transport system substrate-binding protein
MSLIFGYLKPAATVHRELIVALAARYRLPAVYNVRYFVTGGGLISFGTDFVDQFRRAPACVDRILKGEKPADLAVQAPTKYELVINLKTHLWEDIQKVDEPSSRPCLKHRPRCSAA